MNLVCLPALFLPCSCPRLAQGSNHSRRVARLLQLGPAGVGAIFGTKEFLYRPVMVIIAHREGEKDSHRWPWIRRFVNFQDIFLS